MALPDDEFYDSFETVDEINQISFRPNNTNPFLEYQFTDECNSNRLLNPNQLAAAFLTAVESIVDKINKSGARVLTVSFSGTPIENPVTFLNKMEKYFSENGIPEDQKISVAVTCLKNEGLSWYEPYKNLNFNWPDFKNNFLQKFNSTAILSQLSTQLYGQKQRDEEVAIFINRKRCIFIRLCPGMSEDSLINILLEQINPQIRAHLRAQNFTSIEQLSVIATTIEKDLNVNYTQTSTPRNTNTQYQSTQSRPPTPCRYCSDWHYHNQCPRNPNQQSSRNTSFRSNNSRRNPENQENWE